MTLTNGDIFQAKDPLQKLIGEKFPVKVSYKLAKLVGILNDELKSIDQARLALINKYGSQAEGERKKSVKEDSPNWDAFVAEFNELMAIEVSSDVEKKIAVEKVRLPEKVAATCDKCGHNMDKMLEIEPKILIDLTKFIEVA